MRDDAEAILKLDRKEVWREKSGAPRTAFAAHTFNETFRLLGLPSAAGRTAPPALWRGRLRASVQAQRQGGVRGRRLAVASGLRHLGARRRHAGAARHEHRGVPRRGDADQRRADGDPEEPQAGRAGGRPRHRDHVLSAVDARQRHRDAARGARRHRGADRQARLGADVPRQSGARLAAEHHALSAQDRLSDAVRLLQPHHQIHPRRMDRAPRFYADRAGRRRRAAAICAGASARAAE